MSEISDLLGGTGTEQPRMLKKKESAPKTGTKEKPKLQENPLDTWMQDKGKPLTVKTKPGNASRHKNETFSVVATETFLANLYSASFTKIIPINQEVWDANADILEEMHEADRIVPLEAASFIANNFDGLLALLILNIEDFRETCLNIVMMEADIDEATDDLRDRVRQTMSPCFADSSDSILMVMQATMFSHRILAELLQEAKEASDAFDSLSIAKDMAKALPQLDEQAMNDLSIILSAWVYMIRAFSLNGTFVDECKRLLTEYVK